MSDNESISGWIVEDLDETLADIVKQEIYKQYGFEVSIRLRWTDVNNVWRYDILLENVSKTQYSFVSEFAYGIVRGIKAYMDYNGDESVAR